jgi:hypothetical protein|tara:strand:+ start:25332 stop:25688 length:357 start_codon:yes stop_codon:yes gene_type:complete
MDKIILSKKCENCCPACGAEGDIRWGDKEWQDDVCYQWADCNKCGTEFREYWKYSDTEWEVDKVDWEKVYENGQCPDCFEDINKAAQSGDECHNCSHVFHLPEGTRQVYFPKAAEDNN